MIANALSIAGSDPSGGAGIQADLKTFSALGVYGAAAVTALTAQSTRGVSAVHDLPAAFVVAEIDALFEDLRIDAVKIGMLASAAVAEAVADRLAHYGAQNVILDPVMVSTSGARLLAEDAVDVMRRRLLPLATLVTPNLAEAAVLLGEAEPDSVAAMSGMARRLQALGPRAVLLKGGHLAGEASPDVFFDGADLVELLAKRGPAKNTHGTGCTLSSAVAAFVAKGEDKLAACRAAKAYVTAAIAAGDRLSVGHGSGPLHHFHALWES